MLTGEKGAIGIAGSIFLLVTAGIVIAGLTYYGGDMLQRAQTESKIGQHARQASTFGNAVADFVDAKGDGLSDGRHVYTASDLQSLGFLNKTFDTTTPWGEEFVVYLYKNGDEISGVISEYGSVDKKAVRTVVDKVNATTLKKLKLRVAQKRLQQNPTSSDVPGIGKDGRADGVKGMFEDVDISTYVSDGTYRYVSLMNVDGLGSLPMIGNPNEQYHQFIDEMRRSFVQVRHCDSYCSQDATGTRSDLMSQTMAEVGVIGSIDDNDYIYVRLLTPNSHLRNQKLCLHWGDNYSWDRKNCGYVKNGWVRMGFTGNVDENDYLGVSLEGSFPAPYDSIVVGWMVTGQHAYREMDYVSVNSRAAINPDADVGGHDTLGFDVFVHGVHPDDFN